MPTHGAFGLDVVSASTVARCFLCGGVITLWSLLWHTWGSGVSLRTMWAIAAVSVVSLALWRRERPFARHLDRWDEGAVYFGLSTLASVLGY